MKILLATDGSKYSMAAVDSVCSRQWPSGSQFLVLSIVEPIISVADPMLAMYEGAAIEDLRASHQEYATNAADLVRQKLPECVVETQVIDGNAPDQIVHKAKEWGADFVVLGSHGRRGLEKFLLGSVAEAVVAKACCSVEVIKLARVRKNPTINEKAGAMVH